jgi:hypothetical protein
VIGRIVISDAEPVIGCGRLPAKAVAGEIIELSATVTPGDLTPAAREPRGRQECAARMLGSVQG